MNTIHKIGVLGAGGGEKLVVVVVDFCYNEWFLGVDTRV